MRRLLIVIAFVILLPAALLAACTASLHDAKDSWVTQFSDGCPSTPGACNPGATSVDLQTDTVVSPSSNNLLSITNGDIILINAWIFSGGTVTSITLSSGQSTSNGGVIAVGATWPTSSEFGQDHMYYAVALNTGTTNVTFVRGGTSGDGLQHQVSAMSFTPSTGCTWSHHLDSTFASGTGNNATSPSITAAGDLLFNFTMFNGHSNVWSSPWVATTWPPDAFQGLTNSSAAVAYVLPQNNGGTIANHISGQFGDGTWGASIASFSLTQLAANQCPSGLPVSGNNCVFVAANGADTNSGSYETAPWLHAPGMPNCASSCAAFTPSPGKGIILRGGDTWHFGTSTSPATGGEWHMDNWAGGTCNYEGTTSGCIYWGVDPTWFTGASWARPIMNGDNPTSTSLVSSCAHQVGTDNNAMALYNGEYLDNFELTGFCSSRNPASSGPSQDIWIVYGGTANIFETNIYIHGWTATTSAGSSNNTIPCTLFGGSTQSTAQQFFVADVVDGSDSNAGACAWGTFPTYSHMKDSMIRYTTQGVGQGCHDIHDNIFEYISNPNLPTHGNILECNNDGNGSTPNVFYNNIMRHINSNFFVNGQVGWWFCPNTTPEYWFNNLAYDTGAYNDGNFWAIAGAPTYSSCTNSGTQKMFNNTLSGALQPCHLSGSNGTGGIYLTVANEHLLNTPYDGTGCTRVTNLTMTWATGDSQGYMTGSAGITDTDTCANDTTKPCSPTASGNSTVAAGTDESGYCTTLASYSSELAIGTEAANACKYGTTDGCTYNSSTHAMSCPAQTAIVRPISAAWDAGAYQFNGNSFTPCGIIPYPNARCDLTAVLQVIPKAGSNPVASPTWTTGNITGIGTTWTDANFGNKICRFTDQTIGKTGFTGQTKTAAGSGSGEEQRISVDNTMILVADDGGRDFPLNVNWSTCASSAMYTSLSPFNTGPPGGGIYWNTSVYWSRLASTPHTIFNIGNGLTGSSGAIGLQLGHFDVTNQGALPTFALDVDLTSVMNTVGGGSYTARLVDSAAQDATDTCHGFAVSDLTGQGNADEVYAVVWCKGLGARVLNVSTGVVVYGDYGSTGAITGSFCSGTAIHNVKMWGNGAIRINYNSGCGSPVQATFTWQFAGLSFGPTCTTACSGHAANLLTGYVNNTGNAAPNFWSYRDYTAPGSPIGIIPALPAGGIQAGMDEHVGCPVYNNTFPCLVTTTVFGAVPTVAWANEGFMINPAGTNNPWRMYSCNQSGNNAIYSGSFVFANCISSISQDGHYALFSSDEMCQLGAENLSGNTRSGTAIPGGPNWVTGTVYAAGAVITPGTGSTNAGRYSFQTTTGGTAGGTAPNPWNQTVGGTQSDGGITDWKNIGQETCAGDVFGVILPLQNGIIAPATALFAKVARNESFFFPHLNPTLFFPIQGGSK